MTTIDEYIRTYPEEIRKILNQIRTIIRKAAPQAIETINYGIPTFKIGDRNLVHFAAFKKHIGFYPTPSGIEAFREELSGYKKAKGSVQFSLNEPIPLELIRRITEFRINESQPGNPAL